MKVMAVAKIGASNQRAWSTLFSIGFLPQSASGQTAAISGRSGFRARQDHCVLVQDLSPAPYQTEALTGNVCPRSKFG